MTPGDVVDAIISDDRITHFRDVAWAEKCQSDDAMQIFFAAMEVLRPGPDAKQWLPMSPSEIDRLRVSLRTILDAVDVARARKPAHFYVVVKGGR